MISIGVRRFPIVALLATVLGGGALKGTVSWDSGGDGTSWNDTLNWDADAVPVAGDDVVVTMSGT